MINLVEAHAMLRQYVEARYRRTVYCSVHVEIGGYSALHGGPGRIEVSLYSAEAGPDGRHHFVAPTLKAAWGLMVAHHAAQDAQADSVVELPA